MTFSYTKIFIHGLQNFNKGKKSIFFSQKYPEMILKNFTGSLEERMQQLHNLLASKTNIIIIGSSYGGLMASLYTCMYPSKISKLILLAPALDLYHFDICLSKTIDIPVILIHGIYDNIVSPNLTKKKAQIVFKNLSYYLVNDDHQLKSSFDKFDWDKLLKIN